MSIERTRALFYVSSVNSSPNYNNKPSDRSFRQEVHFNAVYSTDASTEKGRFWNASPSGGAKMVNIVGSADNPNWTNWHTGLVGALPGQHYYIDITPSEAEKPGGDVFRCMSVERLVRMTDGVVSQVTVRLECHTRNDESVYEHFNVTIQNEAVFEFFKEGALYDVAFTAKPD